MRVTRFVAFEPAFSILGLLGFFALAGQGWTFAAKANAVEVKLSRSIRLRTKGHSRMENHRWQLDVRRNGWGTER